MRSYFCSACQVAWPFSIPYRHCPGCRRTLPPADYEPLEGELAEDIASTLIAEREMDEAAVRAFQREMDEALGPSA